MATILTILGTDTFRSLIEKLNLNFASLDGVHFATRAAKASSFTAWTDDTSSVKPDYYAVTGTSTCTMPAATTTDAAAGRRTTIKNVGVATVTVDTTGGDTIDGSASVSLAVNDSITLVSDGASNCEAV